MWCHTVKLRGRVWYLVMPSALYAVYASEMWCSTCDLMCWVLSLQCIAERRRQLSQWILVAPPCLVADVKVTERRTCRGFPTHAHDFILSPVILCHDSASDHECSLRLLRPLSLQCPLLFVFTRFLYFLYFVFFPLSFCFNCMSIFFSFISLFYCSHFLSLLLFSLLFSFNFLLYFLSVLSSFLYFLPSFSLTSSPPFNMSFSCFSFCPSPSPLLLFSYLLLSFSLSPSPFLSLSSSPPFLPSPFLLLLPLLLPSPFLLFVSFLSTLRFCRSTGQKKLDD